MSTYGYQYKDKDMPTWSVEGEHSSRNQGPLETKLPMGADDKRAEEGTI